MIPADYEVVLHHALHNQRRFSFKDVCRINRLLEQPEDYTDYDIVFINFVGSVLDECGVFDGKS